MPTGGSGFADLRVKERITFGYTCCEAICSCSGTLCSCLLGSMGSEDITETSCQSAKTRSTRLHVRFLVVLLQMWMACDQFKLLYRLCKARANATNGSKIRRFSRAARRKLPWSAKDSTDSSKAAGPNQCSARSSYTHQPHGITKIDDNDGGRCPPTSYLLPTACLLSTRALASSLTCTIKCKCMWPSTIYNDFMSKEVTKRARSLE